VPDEREALTGLASVGVIKGNGEVARWRERKRRSRLWKVLFVLVVLQVWFLVRDLTGASPIPVPHVSSRIVPYLPAMGLLLVLVVVMLGPLLGAGRSPHSLFRPADLEVGLDDVVGIDSCKAEVVRTVNLFLGHKAFRDHMGGMPRRGVLFEGPPGTGKTFTAKAMAKEADVPFLFVSASAFQSMFYGQTNRKIRSYFRALRKYARAEGGAIGFIEEIDAIGATRRSMGGMSGEGISGVVNELLVQLQSFDEPTGGQRMVGALIEMCNRFLPYRRQLQKPQPPRANVLVVAATNRRDDLDPALLRPGRFDRSLYFGLPGKTGRTDIIEYYLARKAHGTDLEGHWPVEEIASMTPGYSPADLERLLDEALVVALTKGRHAMEMADVAEAKLSVELGLTDAAVYTPEEKLRVATHEAGHATVAYFVGAGRQLDVLSIVKRRGALGLLQHSNAEERFTQNRSELEAFLCISMGGLAAEELWFEGDVSSGPGGDLAAATKTACAMVGGYGMGGSLISLAAKEGPMTRGLVDAVLDDSDARQAVEDLLAEARQRARDILHCEHAVVEALREALVTRDELIGRQIFEVIESVPGVAGRGKAHTRQTLTALG
jgi:ATP-dependent Zn protease